jgi:hypothetical protein
MNPKDLIKDVANGLLEDLDEVAPFMCIQCGASFACLDDIIYHILTSHDFIMCKLATGKLITYPEFLKILSGRMVSSVMNDMENSEPKDI